MDKETKAWFEFFAEWFEHIDHRLGEIQRAIGKPVDQAKIAKLKKKIDAKRAELAAVVEANKP